MLASFLLLLLRSGLARAADPVDLAPKALLLHVEVEGGPLDPGSVRVLVRRAIPASFLILDAEQFRDRLTAKGERIPISKRLYSPATQSTVVERVRQSARDLRADGVIIASARATPKDRQARMQVRFFFVDAESRPNNEPPPLTFSGGIALPKKVKIDADTATIAQTIGPVLERFSAIRPPGGGPAASSAGAVARRPVYNPLAPTAGGTAAVVREGKAAPATATAAQPLPVRAGISVRVFPVAGLFSTAFANIQIPLSPVVTFIPSAGAAYLAPADEGKTTVPPFFGLGFRYALSRDFWLSPSVDFAPNFVLAGNVAMGATLAPALKLNLVLTASRYTIFAFKGPLLESHAYLDVPTKPFKWLSFIPHVMYFVYSEDLTKGTSSMTGLAAGLAPYPIHAMLGIRVGYETGRLSPYVATRHFFYDANSGDANTLGVGVKLTQGSDYLDARIGAIFSNGKGPFATAQLETIPVANVEAGWSF